MRAAIDEFPGRTTLRCLIPDDLIAEVNRLAADLQVSPAEVMGDLVASVLPAALSEAVDSLIGTPAHKRLCAGTADLPVIDPADSGACDTVGIEPTEPEEM